MKDNEGNYNRKLIYTKDGIEKEISYEKYQSIRSHYNQITVNKRKVLECSLDINTDDFINTQ